MTKVIIAFDADHARIGKTVELDPDAARVAVREGRARYVDEADQPAPTAPTDTPPVPEKASPEPVETDGTGGKTKRRTG